MQTHGNHSRAYIPLTELEDASAEKSEGVYRSNSNELDAGRKILKYTLCGDYGYACGKGAESIFLLIYPSHPRSIFSATDEIWIKVSGTARVAPLGLDSLATFYNCAVSLNMYRFAPRVQVPPILRPPPVPVPPFDDITASVIIKNICFRDNRSDRCILILFILCRS